MMKKGRRQQRQSEEDAVFNRMLIWLAGAVVVELLILLVKRLYVDIDELTDTSVAIANGLLTFFEVFRFVGIALAVVGVIWSALALKGKKKALLPLVSTGVMLILWVITLFSYYMYDRGLRILMVLPAIGAVLIVIYFLYQRSFFINAILTGGGITALWIYRQNYQNHPTVVTLCFIGGWIVLALVVALTVWAGRSNGKLGPVQWMTDRASYIMSVLTCVITAAAMLLGLLLGATVAYYLIFVLVGWLFCQAVYYTVKLM